MSETTITTPGLQDPIDGAPIISPGQLVGGDSITIASSFPAYDAAPDLENIVIGLIQGASISSNRMARNVYQVGSDETVVISSMGQKQLTVSTIITEESNMIRALYKFMLENADALYAGGFVTEAQYNVLARYAIGPEIPEGIVKDLLRIPFGLTLTFMSGDGEFVQGIHLGHCVLSSDDNAIEAGTRGIGENNMIMWQKTTYFTND